MAINHKWKMSSEPDQPPGQLQKPRFHSGEGGTTLLNELVPCISFESVFVLCPWLLHILCVAAFKFFHLLTTSFLICSLHNCRPQSTIFSTLLVFVVWTPKLILKYIWFSVYASSFLFPNKIESFLRLDTGFQFCGTHRTLQRVCFRTFQDAKQIV